MGWAGWRSAWAMLCDVALLREWRQGMGGFRDKECECELRRECMGARNSKCAQMGAARVGKAPWASTWLRFNGLTHVCVWVMRVAILRAPYDVMEQLLSTHSKAAHSQCYAMLF